MPTTTKRVFYVNALGDPVFADILGAHPDIRLDRLPNQPPDAAALAVIGAAHVCQSTSARDDILPQYQVGAWMIANAPNLLAVSTHGSGTDTIDMAMCSRAGVLVLNQAGGNAEAVAEQVLGLMLCLTKQVMTADHVMRREIIPRAGLIGRDALGKTIGIVGFGHVGRRVAELCRGLLQMRVAAYDPYLSAAEMAAHGVEKSELDTLMAGCDFVSINCPLTHETAGMIDARRLGLMKSGAILINTARGGIMDETALATLLKEKRIAGAGIDVWDKEPPALDHPLLALDNVLLSPHIAGVTVEARSYSARIAAEQVVDLLNGKRPPRLLNPEAWPLYQERFARIFGVRPV